MSRGSEAMYDLLRVIEGKPADATITWGELVEAVRGAADWTALGEYDDYMGQDM